MTIQYESTKLTFNDNCKIINIGRRYGGYRYSSPISMTRTKYYLGISESAELLGMKTPANFNELYKSGRTPPPVAFTGTRPAWTFEQIQAFGTSLGMTEISPLPIESKKELYFVAHMPLKFEENLEVLNRLRLAKEDGLSTIQATNRIAQDLQLTKDTVISIERNEHPYIKEIPFYIAPTYCGKWYLWNEVNEDTLLTDSKKSMNTLFADYAIRKGFYAQLQSSKARNDLIEKGKMVRVTKQAKQRTVLLYETVIDHLNNIDVSYVIHCSKHSYIPDAQSGACYYCLQTGRFLSYPHIEQQKDVIQMNPLRILLFIMKKEKNLSFEEWEQECLHQMQTLFPLIQVRLDELYSD